MIILAHTIVAVVLFLLLAGLCAYPDGFREGVERAAWVCVFAAVGFAVIWAFYSVGYYWHPA